MELLTGPAKHETSERVPSGTNREGGVPPRIRWIYVLAVALPLIVLNTGWIANSEMKTNVTEVTISSLFIGVTFILFVVTLLNLCIKKLHAGTVMNQAELMVVYSALSMSSVVGGMSHFGFIAPFLVDAFYYSNSSNNWHVFLHDLPWYIGPRDPVVLNGFFEGRSSFFRLDVLAAWAGPLTVWSLFLLVLLWTTLCLSAMVRRRWMEDEHLPFPVIALPMEMTREGAPIYRNRLLWIGFALPCALHSLNSLQSIFPALPTMKINSQHDFVQDLALTRPWTGLDTLYYQLHPAGVGFGYLINTDVSFSLWFFYLLKKALNIVGVMYGWRDPGQGWAGDSVGQFPFTGYQGYGAWLALGLTVVWTGRHYYKAYFQRALRGDTEGVDVNEPLSARVALFGFLAGILAMCVFVWTSGGYWWLPVVFLGVYCLIVVALTRIRAETAVLSTELGWISPQSIMPAVLGTAGLREMDAVHMGMLSWFNLDYRSVGMPHELEAMVGVKRAGGTLRPLVGVLLLAAVVAMISALVWDLQMYYVHGAATGNVNQWRVIWKGNEPWNNVAKWIYNPRPPDMKAIGGMAAGFGITCLLTVLRSRFVGFPFHPAGYVLSTSFANDFFWCDMFVAWAVKSLILRYGGLLRYRQFMPFFLGLILGDFVTGAAWSILGTFLRISLFRTFAT